jgi:hypothetical protein
MAETDQAKTAANPEAEAECVPCRIAGQILVGAAVVAGVLILCDLALGGRLLGPLLALLPHRAAPEPESTPDAGA